MALSDNIIAYWKLDESSGNASDSVGGYTLTNSNSVTYTASLINNGADFGASNTDKSFFIASDLGITTNISYSFYVKIQTEPASGEVQSFVMFNDADSDTRLIVGYQNNAGTKRLVFLRNKDGVAANNFYYDVTLGTTNWHHIVLTYDGSTVTGYLDGSSVGTVSSSGGGSVPVTSRFSLTGVTGTGLLATDYGTNGYAKAYMDEVAVWSRAITSGEVTTLYNGGVGLQYPFSYSSIAYDSSAYSESTGVNSITYSHTCSTGSNRILFVSALSQSADNLTGITYGGVSMTQVNKVAKGSDYLYLYYLVAPATGANNVVVSRSSSSGVLWSASSSYTGAKQTAVPDAQATNSNTSSTSITGTVTTVADNCWLVGSVFCDNLGYSAGTGTKLRQTHSIVICDSDSATTPAGSDSLAINCGSGNNAICVASFAPYSGVIVMTADTGSFTLTGNNVGLSFGRRLVAGVGSFILTGIDVILRATGIVWTYPSKPTTNYDYPSKPTTNYDYPSKPTTNYTYPPKP